MRRSTDCAPDFRDATAPPADALSDENEAGQVPNNLPGLATSAELREFELHAAAIRVAELERHPQLVEGTFDFAHLRALHHHILQDVYAWAGQERQVGQDTQNHGDGPLPTRVSTWRAAPRVRGDRPPATTRR